MHSNLLYNDTVHKRVGRYYDFLPCALGLHSDWPRARKSLVQSLGIGENIIVPTPSFVNSITLSVSMTLRREK